MRDCAGPLEQLDHDAIFSIGFVDMPGVADCDIKATDGNAVFQ